jgi:hypothetical protein
MSVHSIAHPTTPDCGRVFRRFSVRLLGLGMVSETPCTNRRKTPKMECLVLLETNGLGWLDRCFASIRRCLWGWGFTKPISSGNTILGACLCILGSWDMQGAVV